MPELPTGVVTYLFTDIAGSTRLLQSLGDRYLAVLADHDRLMRDAVQAARGAVVNTEGDAFFCVFRSPRDAVSAAVAAQRELAAHPWPPEAAVQVRMGMHTGEGVTGGADYAGIDVNRAARIAAIGHGGQVLLSDATRALVASDLPPATSIRTLGSARLKDFDQPEAIFQLAIEGLPAEFPPLRGAETPNNLPVGLSSFVGRDRELAETAGLLAAHRLLTLTGPGGTGKTRLAIELARAELGEFRSGTFLVRLETATDRSLVASATAQALALREVPGRDLESSLQDHLAARDMLLVFDNFEQVVSAAPLVDILLAAAPGLRVVATSRGPLRLFGEQEYPVPPLSLPDLSRTASFEAVATSPAVTLFVDRAAAVDPHFALTDANAMAVGELCARLDGLPLAIELAAARIRILDPAAILARVRDRLDFLQASAPNLPLRQRSLRATMEWSHELLAEPERRLFRRLAVFRGGWDLEALEQVCDPNGDLGADPLEVLASLVENGLVRPTTGREGRFGMLQTIASFATERLEESGEVETSRARHAEWVQGLALRAEPELLMAQQSTWLDRLGRDHDNIRAALRWLIDQGEATAAARIASAVWRFWQQRSHVTEGREWLRAILALVPPGDERLLASTHLAAAGLAYWQGDMDAFQLAAEQAEAISRRIDDSPGIADAA